LIRIVRRQFPHLTRAHKREHGAGEHFARAHGERMSPLSDNSGGPRPSLESDRAFATFRLVLPKRDLDVGLLCEACQTKGMTVECKEVRPSRALLRRVVRFTSSTTAEHRPTAL